jgi:hypothetical protein
MTIPTAKKPIPLKEDQDRKTLEDKLKRKRKSLLQQLRRTKARKQTMGDIIQELQQKLHFQRHKK